MELWQLQRRVLLACTRAADAGIKPASIYYALLAEYTDSERMDDMYLEARENFADILDMRISEAIRNRNNDRNAGMDA